MNNPPIAHKFTIPSCTYQGENGGRKKSGAQLSAAILPVLSLLFFPGQHLPDPFLDAHALWPCLMLRKNAPRQPLTLLEVVSLGFNLPDLVGPGCRLTVNPDDGSRDRLLNRCEGLLLWRGIGLSVGWRHSVWVLIIAWHRSAVL